MAKDLSSFLKNSTNKLKENLRFEANSEFEQTIKDWVEERIEVADKVLKDSGNSSTGALGQSIQPRPLKKEEGKMIVEILANDYWKFINYGVNGLLKSQSSRYSFKNLGVGVNMHKSFSDFIKNRGITPNNNQTFESLAYALAVGVKKKGIEGNQFMDIAFGEKALKELSDRLELKVVSVFSL